MQQKLLKVELAKLVFLANPNIIEKTSDKEQTGRRRVQKKESGVTQSRKLIEMCFRKTQISSKKHPIKNK